MDNTTTDAKPLLAVFESLGQYSRIVAETLDLLRVNGKKNRAGNHYTRAVVYDVIHERSVNADVAEAFLQAAEAEVSRREHLKARATEVVAKATA